MGSESIGVVAAVTLAYYSTADDNHGDLLEFNMHLFSLDIHLYTILSLSPAVTCVAPIPTISQQSSTMTHSFLAHYTP